MAERHPLRDVAERVRPEYEWQDEDLDHWGAAWGESDDPEHRGWAEYLEAVCPRRLGGTDDDTG